MHVFSGGDNKIGVAVRKPDGSVALPYKWQVSSEPFTWESYEKIRHLPDNNKKNPGIFGKFETVGTKKKL